MSEILHRTIRLRTPERGWLVHPDLRARMIEDAAEKHTTISDLTAQILAAKLKVTHEPLQRKSSPTEAAGDQLPFDLPARLASAVAAAAPTNNADWIRKTLCDHYGLSVPPKVPLPRRRRAEVTPA